MKYFESRTYGEVLSRITNDVDTLGKGLNQSITTIITSLATLIGVLIMMLSISPLMTLIALVILPISMGLIGLVTKKSQKFFRAQQEYLSTSTVRLEEVYGTISSSRHLTARRIRSKSLKKPTIFFTIPHGNPSFYPV